MTLHSLRSVNCVSLVSGPGNCSVLFGGADRGESILSEGSDPPPGIPASRLCNFSAKLEPGACWICSMSERRIRCLAHDESLFPGPPLPISEHQSRLTFCDTKVICEAGFAKGRFTRPTAIHFRKGVVEQAGRTSNNHGEANLRNRAKNNWTACSLQR